MHWKVAIPLEEVAKALGKAEAGAIAFVHFGACEMVVPGRRRESHSTIRDACGSPALTPCGSAR